MHVSTYVAPPSPITQPPVPTTQQEVVVETATPSPGEDRVNEPPIQPPSRATTPSDMQHVISEDGQRLLGSIEPGLFPPQSHTSSDSPLIVGENTEVQQISTPRARLNLSLIHI